MKKEKNPFFDKMNSHSNNELMDIINNRYDYQPVAIEAALHIAFKRNLISTNQKDEIQKELADSLNLENIKLNNAELKSGLKLFYLNIVVFLGAFILARVLGLDFDEDYIAFPLFIIVGVIFVVIPSLFSKPKTIIENDDNKKYSIVSIWIAEAYADKINKKTGNFIYRRSIINFFIALPCIIFTLTSGIDDNSYEYNDDYVETKHDVMKTIDEYQKEINAMKDTFNLLSNAVFNNEAERFMDEKKFDSALFYFKKLEYYQSADSVVFYQIGFCYQKLSKKDSACLYLKKSMDMGYPEAKINFNKNCK